MAVTTRKRQVLGGAVRQIRILKGLRQDDLAQAAHISPSFYCRIEKSERQPTVEVMVALADTLGVGIDDITYWTVVMSLADEVAA